MNSRARLGNASRTSSGHGGYAHKLGVCAVFFAIGILGPSILLRDNTPRIGAVLHATPAQGVKEAPAEPVLPADLMPTQTPPQPHSTQQETAQPQQ